MMKIRYLIAIGVFILSIFGGLVWSAFHYSDKAATARAKTAYLSRQCSAGAGNSHQAFNINRFNKIETAAQANAIVAGTAKQR
jgi:cbb3-type cytochrome oxidase subunit 3